MAQKNSHYITAKESRAIIKYNIKQMKYYEALKKKKLNFSFTLGLFCDIL